MTLRCITLAALLVILPEWAQAAPVEGNVGIIYKPLNPEIVGIDAELGPSAAPWSVGFLYETERYERLTGNPDGGHIWVNPRTTTLWGRYSVDLPNGDSLSGLAGVNYYPKSAFIDQLTPDAWKYIGPVVGLSYTLRSGRIWLRVTPHFVFSPDKPYQEHSWLTKSGIPWVEVGLHLLPQAQLSFRLSEAFAKLAWTFD